MIVTFLVLSACDDHCLWYCSSQHVSSNRPENSLFSLSKNSSLHHSVQKDLIQFWKQKHRSLHNSWHGPETVKAAPKISYFQFARKHFPGSKYPTKYFISSWKQKHWSLSYQSFASPRWSALHDIPSLVCIMQLLAATWSCISRRFSPYPLCQWHGRHVGASKVFIFSKLNYFISGYFDSRNLDNIFCR